MALTKISTDGVKDDAITKSKIPANQIEASELADNAVDTNAIADQAVSLSKLSQGTSSNDGKFLRANNGADPTFETISTTPADGSIGEAKLANNAVTNSKIANTAITQEKLNIPLSNRNLIINGAMNVAQRSASAVASTGFQTVDRWQFSGNWGGSAITQQQATIGYNTAPYDKGFRKSYKLTNSNQGSASAGDNIEITYSFEGDEIATSGWDYVNSSKKITLSFWIKSSVAQTFYGYFRTFVGVDMKYSFPIVCSTTDWEFKTVSIVGEPNFAQNIQNSFGNGRNRAMVLRIVPFYGTTYTDSGAVNNAWQNYSASTITPVYDTSWFLTNGATFELTGVQLEVGNVHTSYEHKSFTEEYLKCARYFQRLGGNRQYFVGRTSNSDGLHTSPHCPVPLRNTPTISMSGSFELFSSSGQGSSSVTPTVDTYATDDFNQCVLGNVFFVFSSGSYCNDARVGTVRIGNTIDFDAEL